jgi:uncharacterized protein with PIN domain
MSDDEETRVCNMCAQRFEIERFPFRGRRCLTCAVAVRSRQANVVTYEIPRREVNDAISRPEKTAAKRAHKARS